MLGLKIGDDFCEQQADYVDYKLSEARKTHTMQNVNINNKVPVYDMASNAELK